MVKKPVEIEKLLRWAFREELPKGKPVSASAWDSIAQFGALGARVQTSGYGHDGLGFVPGTPHEDAEKVALAVRQLDRTTRLSELECWGLLGIYADCDPIAIKAVTLAAFTMAPLVIRCAILGSGMEWDVGTPQLRPVTRPDNQRPLMFGVDVHGELIEVKADRRGYYDPSLAPRAHVRWDEPTIGQLLEARAEYAVWHRALARLAVALDGSLKEHHVLMPASMPEPWITGQPPASRILKAARPRPMTSMPLPLAPQRGIKAGPPIESAIEARTRLRKVTGRKRKAETGNAGYAHYTGFR